MKHAIALAIALAFAATTAGCAGAIGRGRPAAATTQPCADYSAALYGAGVTSALVALAFVIDADTDPATAEASQGSLVPLGIVTAASAAGTIWAAHRAGSCRRDVLER